MAEANTGGIKITLGRTTVKATGVAYRPLNDDHPNYRLIGLIAAETARIERMVEQSICYIAGIDMKLGACFTGQMIGPGPRFTAWKQVASLREVDSKLIKKIDLLMGHAGDLFNSRNRVVHDAWLEDGSQSSHQYRSKPKRDPSFGPTPVSESDLQEILAKLRNHREDVINLVNDIYNSLRPT